MSKLTYSINELFSENFLDTQKNWHFVIPDYQRGYKWGKEPVTKLLNDIEKFDFHGEEEKFYCLNNLTIVKQTETEKDIEYNVVDGQQRLTTITVILACLKHIETGVTLPQFEDKIKYRIRGITQDFLSKLIINDKFTIDGKNVHFHDFSHDENSVSWNDFIKFNEIYDYQDVFYLFSAYKTIFNWLKEHENFRKEFTNKLLNHVKLIVNNVPDVENEATFFGNLNSNKVQLDGADLVRALIITNVARIEADEVEDSLKRKILINERRVRIGLQIDSIMHWWKDPDHQEYYKIVIKNIQSDPSNIKFEEDKNPLNYLYKIFSLLFHNKSVIRLENFEEDIVSQWNNILQLQRVLEQWYNDDKLYHALGFVLRYCHNTNIKKIFFEEWKEKSIGVFYTYLLEQIKTRFEDLLMPVEKALAEAEYRKECFEENWYEGYDVIPIMILLDIIQEEKKGKRIPVSMFQKNEEDKEHIFPQTPLGHITNMKEIEDRKVILKEYINLVNEIVDSTNQIIPPKPITEWTEDEMRSNVLDKLQTEINDKIKQVVPINCLGNICLLDETINRSYGNDFYTAKRLAVVNHYFKGNSIRPHVIEAFDKSWKERNPKSSSKEDLRNWTTDDIIERRKHIIESINAFLGGSWNIKK